MKQDNFSKLVSESERLLDSINVLEANIIVKTELFKKYIADTEEQIKKEKEEYEKLTKQTTIPIRLADLVNEICEMTKIDIVNLDIAVTTNRFKNKVGLDYIEDLTLENLSKNTHTNLEVQIKQIGKSNGLKIFMYFPLDFHAKFADGSVLFDNLGLKDWEKDLEIVVDKNIANYICNFSLDGILNGTSVVSNSKNLISNAVISLYNKGKAFTLETSEEEPQY